MKKILILTVFIAMQLGSLADNLVSNDFGKTVKVKGTMNIESVVKALFDASPSDWDGDATYDKKNGYFHYFQEGAGSVSYYVSYWNRKDGKKLVIVSYRASEFGKPLKKLATSWYYRSSFTIKTGDGKETLNVETGFCAYIYNAKTKQLVPMKRPPFNNFKNPLNGHYLLVLPQEGKDITVREEMSEGKFVDHSLMWNGLNFDYYE